MIIRTLLIASFLIFLGGNALQAQEYDYIGAAKCKVCHNKASTGAQYKIWLEGPHANAMNSLSAEEAKDPKCIKCHATAGHADPNFIAGLKMDEGVSCESCHGPGSGYKSNTVMKSREKSLEKGLILPTEEVCVKCHNEESPTFKGFDYAEYVKKIAHPNPAKE
ncbi:MAG: multiheme c-type cytochrome [bacterium]|jgi:hypothetical protein